MSANSPVLPPSAGAGPSVAPGVSAPPTRGRAARSVLHVVSRRVLTALVVLWAAVTVTFFALHAAPGTALDVILGDLRDDPQLRVETAARWGFDRPLLAQYLDYLGGVVRGDLGVSYQTHVPVTDLIGGQLGPTVALTGTAATAALLLAGVIGVLTAGHGRITGRVASAVELVLVSVPPFWLGIVGLAVFSFHLRLLPVAGAEGWRSLVLPALTLALPIAAILAQVLREGINRALEEPFAVTARARGLSPSAVRVHHALRHGVLPSMTLAGTIVGGLLGGTVIIEQVFGRPGLGDLTVQAVYAQDLPVVLGVGLLSALVYVVVSTVVDLLYLVIDPRLRAAPTREDS